MIVHGINVRAHLDILLATPRGQQGNEDGYNGVPNVRVIQRARKLRRHGCAWPWRYGLRHDATHVLLNHIPGLDGFNVIETVCHELAHLLAPRRSNHNTAWKAAYRKLAFQAYGVQMEVPNRFVGVLATKLREKAMAGTLGVP